MEFAILKLLTFTLFLFYNSDYKQIAVQKMHVKLLDILVYINEFNSANIYSIELLSHLIGLIASA